MLLMHWADKKLVEHAPISAPQAHKLVEHWLLRRYSSHAPALRSASRPLLHVSRTRTVYGSRSQLPTLWKNLPADIINATSLTVFRNRLKPLLFHHTFFGCPADYSSAVKRLCIIMTLWRYRNCLLYTSPSPRDGLLSRMPSSA